jgi:xylulokinase
MAVGELHTALAEVLARLGDARAQVAAVGVAGVAESGAALAADGRPLAPVIAWYDPRGQEVVDRLLARCGAGLERAIGQRLRVVSSVAKLGWLVDQGVGPVSRWLGVPELAVQALTGRAVTDYSLAARTGAYHLAGRRYLPEVAEAIGVPVSAFAEVAPAGSPLGAVSGAAARWTGLPAGIPVTLAGHDHLAARAGCGAEPRDLVNSVGTAETVVAASALPPDVAAALAHRVALTLAPAGDGWALLASAARAGMVLGTVATAIGSPMEDLDRAALDAGTIPADEGLIEAALSGSPLPLDTANPAAAWNGVLAALAARTWEACDRLLAVLPPAGGAGAGSAGGQGLGSGAGRLIVCGGGSRSLPWLRAKAAARPDTVVCRAVVGEAVARGAAVTAGVAAGWWPTVGAAPRADLVTISPAGNCEP